MARLNITLPDMLYARLEQLRDRINLSKVCALALEKEVTMLEGQPNITDPRIARLLQRLQSTRERWHQRGYEDGLQWAVELATRDELQSVATHLAEQDGQQLAALFQMQGNLHFRTSHSPSPAPHMHPPLPPAQAASGVAIRPPLPPAPGMSPMPPASEFGFHHHHAGIPFPGFPQSFHPAERIRHWEDQDREMSGQAPQGEAARIEVDETAYLEGWRDAVKGIWQTIAPALS
jgi:hypothetical protein